MKFKDNWEKLPFRHFSKKVSFRAVDLCVLYYNFFKANQDETIGFADCRDSIEEIVKYFNVTRWVEKGKLESVLYSANMRDEKGEFWHPEGIDFDTWVKRLGVGKDFDRRYNFFKDAEDEDVKPKRAEKGTDNPFNTFIGDPVPSDGEPK